MISKKIVLIGDFSTGKTSLIRRFVDNQFSDKYLSTIGVKISRKNITLDENEIQNIIWDVEGATESKMLNASYLLGAHGTIVVADITRESSMENMKEHIDLVRSVSDKTAVVIALNKSDLLPRDEAEKILASLQKKFSDIKFVTLTSAKSSEGVTALFQELNNLIMSQ